MGEERQPQRCSSTVRAGSCLLSRAAASRSGHTLPAATVPTTQSLPTTPTRSNRTPLSPAPTSCLLPPRVLTTKFCRRAPRMLSRSGRCRLRTGRPCGAGARSPAQRLWLDRGSSRLSWKISHVHTQPSTSFTSSQCVGRTSVPCLAMAAADLLATHVSSSTSTSHRSAGALTAVFHMHTRTTASSWRVCLRPLTRLILSKTQRRFLLQSALARLALPSPTRLLPVHHSSRDRIRNLYAEICTGIVHASNEGFCELVVSCVHS